MCCLWFADFRRGVLGEEGLDLNNLLSIQVTSNPPNSESPLMLHSVFCMLDLT